jgi:DNA (cytosine-5)-methyltransferase 1
LHAYMRCVEELLPTVFVLENVHGISYSGKEEGFQLLHSMAHQINKRAGTSYRLAWKVISAADYGVPQLRTRFFLVGHRDGGEFKFPDPTHTATDSIDQGELLPSTSLAPYTTAWDALGGYCPPSEEDLAMRGYWADLLPSIPEGENYLWHTNRKGGLQLFGWRTRYWSFLLKLAKAKPSWTLQAQPGPAIGPFHWTSRRLGVQEMARLQTFPRDLIFVGSRVSVQRQLGNAVPSLLAEILGREIARQFLGISPSELPRLAVEPKGPPPLPETVLPVPEKFLIHLGDHDDHPGEGKGRRVSRAATASTEASAL